MSRLYPAGATVEPIRPLLQAFVDRYQVMSPEEQEAEDWRWYLAADERYSRVTDDMMARAVAIPRARLLRVVR